MTMIWAHKSQVIVIFLFQQHRVDIVVSMSIKFNIWKFSYVAIYLCGLTTIKYK